MLFTTPFFLFFFFPLSVLLVNFVQRRNFGWGKTVLLLLSVFFYFFGEGWLVGILIAASVVAWLAAILIEIAPANLRRPTLAITIVVLLGNLFVFKYYDFAATNVVAAFPSLADAVVPLDLALPVGISFYTFHLISYVIDVYRGVVPALRSARDFGLYITLWPPLIAGPIVRLRDIRDDIADPTRKHQNVGFGARLFIIGLFQKTFFADNLGKVVDNVYAYSPADLDAFAILFTAWCYSLQIYFDFAGYSLMAIGIGRMMGFRLPQNFNLPYLATSITNFWRRWHMTLSSWFRDYLYIPLGGNRHGPWATYRNLIIVFAATGIWHGAAWNFVIWGLLHGAFLVIERLGGGRMLRRLPKSLATAYSVAVVTLLWIPFRAPDMTHAAHQWSKLLTGWDDPSVLSPAYLLQPHTLVIMALGTLTAFGVFRRDRIPTLSFEARAKIATIAGSWGLPIMLGIGIFEMVRSTPNAFIYFRF